MAASSSALLLQPAICDESNRDYNVSVHESLSRSVAIAFVLVHVALVVVVSCDPLRAGLLMSSYLFPPPLIFSHLQPIPK